MEPEKTTETPNVYAVLFAGQMYRRGGYTEDGGAAAAAAFTAGQMPTDPKSGKPMADDSMVIAHNLALYTEGINLARFYALHFTGNGTRSETMDAIPDGAPALITGAGDSWKGYYLIPNPIGV